ncbi:MAG: glucose-1-phosphate adenylyltransferase [Candidatus Bipolaricaulaceae bacterium]
MGKVLTFVLAGGRGERLWPLTRDRAKPAVRLGGIYRIIDTLSNCLNSGLRQAFVLTQYKSLSLARHIDLGWSLFSSAVGEFIATVPPQQRIANHWCLRTADAIYQNWYSVERHSLSWDRPGLILAGDHVYKMDYRIMVSAHRERDADLTVGVVTMDRRQAAGKLGVLAVDRDWRVLQFEEKPGQPTPSPEDPGSCLASMGIYAFKTDVLWTRLQEHADDPRSGHDFGRDVINRMVGEDKVLALPLAAASRNDVPYWRDVGSLDAYWDAHMDLVAVMPQFNLYDRRWPIHTYYAPWPPAKTVHREPGRTGEALDSLLSPGCIVSGGRVVRSVLSPGVRVNSYALVEESVLLDDVDVGRGARIRRAIVDKGVNIPAGEEIEYSRPQDERRFDVSPAGVVAIPKEYAF